MWTPQSPPAYPISTKQLSRGSRGDGSKNLLVFTGAVLYTPGRAYDDVRMNLNVMRVKTFSSRAVKDFQPANHLWWLGASVCGCGERAQA